MSTAGPSPLAPDDAETLDAPSSAAGGEGSGSTLVPAPVVDSVDSLGLGDGSLIRSVAPTLAGQQAGPRSGLSAPSAPSALLSSVSTAAARRRFGDYELVRELARGGMGVVYEAVQTSLKRTVAVKMILAGEFASPEQVQRFVAEARSVAHLDHPNIVPVYEVGQHGGLHFFSMKLVDGGSLAGVLQAYLDRPAAAAALVETVARAVHHAHQRGVLHRDLKPGNILLDADGRPMVTDFGLAKLAADDSHVTRPDAVVGTPAYMAPEQARGAQHCTTATDTWALGAILYHLLTGVAPFRGETAHHTLRLVQDAEPLPPRQRSPRVPRDLETVCLTCLRKDVDKRYASAEALADDLRRFRLGEPVAARPVGRAERAWRWCRRNPGLAGAAAAAVLATVAAVVILAAATVQARTFAAEQARANVRLLLQEALRDAEQDPSVGLLKLARVLGRAEAVGAADLADAARLQVAAWERAVHPLRCVVRHEPAGGRGVGLVALAADGAVAYTSGGADAKIRAFAVPAGTPLAEATVPDAVSALAVDPATGRLWVGLADGGTCWWDARRPGSKPVAGPSHVADRRNGVGVKGVAFAPRAGRVLTAGEDGVARVWEAATGRQVGPDLRHGERPILAVVVSEPLDLVVTGCDGGFVRLFRLSSGQPVTDRLSHGEPVWAVGVREAAGQVVVVSRAESMLRGLDGAAGERLGRLPDGTFNAALHPDGRRALVSGEGYLARVVALSGPPEAGGPLRHADLATAEAFSGDGRTMVTGSADGTARVWQVRDADDGSTGPAAATAGGGPGASAAALSPDGTRLAVGSADGAVRVLDVRTRAVVAEFRHGDVVNAVAFSRDGTRLLTASNDNTARMWDLRTRSAIGSPVQHGDWVRIVAFSHDGTAFLTGGNDGQVQVRRSADLAELGPPIVHDQLRAAAFSPDGRRVATVGGDGAVRLWDVVPPPSTGGGRVPAAEATHDRGVWAVAFSPDGTRLATGGDDKLARLWDAVTLRPVGDPMRHGDAVFHVAFAPVPAAPDGTPRAVGRLATAGQEKAARLWDATTGRPAGQPIPLPSAATCLAYGDDGAKLVVGTADGSAVLWDAQTDRPIGPTFRRPAGVTAVGFAPAGDAVLIASGAAGDARLHPVARFAGSVAEAVRRARALTGLDLDAGGAVQVLEPAESATK